jgi:hypothetical protein
MAMSYAIAACRSGSIYLSRRARPIELRLHPRAALELWQLPLCSKMGILESEEAGKAALCD